MAIGLLFVPVECSGFFVLHFTEYDCLLIYPVRCWKLFPAVNSSVPVLMHLSVCSCGYSVRLAAGNVQNEPATRTEGGQVSLPSQNTGKGSYSMFNSCIDI